MLFFVLTQRTKSQDCKSFAKIFKVKIQTQFILGYLILLCHSRIKHAFSFFIEKKETKILVKKNGNPSLRVQN